MLAFVSAQQTFLTSSLKYFADWLKAISQYSTPVTFLELPRARMACRTSRRNDAIQLVVIQRRLSWSTIEREISTWAGDVDRRVEHCPTTNRRTCQVVTCPSIIFPHAQLYINVRSAVIIRYEPSRLLRLLAVRRRNEMTALLPTGHSLVFTARRYASAVYAVVMCLSVCLSQAGTVPKRLKIGSCKQRRTIAQGL